ncbi:MAG: monovalent cation/H+ antiporter subunit D family protein [Pseudomonadota bacterium]
MSGLQAHLPALQLVVPLLTAPVLVLLGERRLSWLMATLASLCAFLIAATLAVHVLAHGPVAYAMGNWPAPFGIALQVDAVSALLLLVVTGASSLGLLAAATSLSTQIQSERQPLFFAAWLLGMSGLCGMLVSADAFNIFVFMEISSLASYVLVAGGPDRRALPAVFKYLVMGTLGATFYLIGIGLIYLMTGTLNLADMAERVGEVADLKPILMAAGFIIVGLALKAAIFPLHVWLPNAYTFAPHVVTVFIAACSTKVALYVLLRFDFIVLQPNLSDHEMRFVSFLLPLSVLAVLLASAVAVFEANLKRLLAWSSVAQIGYIVMGASLLSHAGVSAALLHMFNHALAKGALFLSLACLALSVSSLRIEHIGGIAKRMPWTMAAFAVGGISLIGVPGTAGFISKWYLISAALDFEPVGGLLVAIILISSLMSVIYIWRVVERAYFGDMERQQTQENAREAPLGILIPTWIAVALNIIFGLQPQLPQQLAAQGATALGILP